MLFYGIAEAFDLVDYTFKSGIEYLKLFSSKLRVQLGINFVSV